MNHKHWAAFQADFAGCLITNSRVTDQTLYCRYVRFCERKGLEPDTYETLLPALCREVLSLSEWWGSYQLFLVNTELGNFIDSDLG